MPKHPTMTEKNLHPVIEFKADVNFSKQLKQAVQLLRTEMQEEVNLLKQRLHRCEKANRDLVARFDSEPWKVSEQLKKQPAVENETVAQVKKAPRQRVCVTNHDEVVDSPRGGFGSNYETNAMASKVMKPQQTITIHTNQHNRQYTQESVNMFELKHTPSIEFSNNPGSYKSFSK